MRSYGLPDVVDESGILRDSVSGYYRAKICNLNQNYFQLSNLLGSGASVGGTGWVISETSERSGSDLFIPQGNSDEEEWCKGWI